MKKKEPTTAEVLKSNWERELAELQEIDSKLYKEYMAAEKKGDTAKADSLMKTETKVMERIQVIEATLKYAGELQTQALTDRKIASDMWVNRLNVGGHLLIGGTGLYLGYRTDKNGALTNKSPLSFFSQIFGGMIRSKPT
jgi:hypothetical protein